MIEDFGIRQFGPALQAFDHVRFDSRYFAFLQTPQDKKLQVLVAQMQHFWVNPF